MAEEPLKDAEGQEEKEEAQESADYQHYIVFILCNFSHYFS